MNCFEIHRFPNQFFEFLRMYYSILNIRSKFWEIRGILKILENANKNEKWKILKAGTGHISTRKPRVSIIRRSHVFSFRQAQGGGERAIPRFVFVTGRALQTGTRGPNATDLIGGCTIVEEKITPRLMREGWVGGLKPIQNNAIEQYYIWVFLRINM